MKLNKDKCKALQLWKKNWMHKYNMGVNWLGNSIMVDQTQHESAMWCSQKKKQVQFLAVFTEVFYV